MKRKFMLAGLAALVVLVCILAFSPLGVGIEKKELIHAPIMDVATAITDLRNWQQCNADLRGIDRSALSYSGRTQAPGAWLQAGKSRYTTLSLTAASIGVREEKSNSNRIHAIYLYPESSGESTLVIWNESLGPFAWLKEKLLTSSVQQNLDNLKRHFEDARENYGFDIQFDQVRDTLVVNEVHTVPKTQRQAVLSAMFADIASLVNGQHIGRQDSSLRMAYFQPDGKDSVRVMAAIPVIRLGRPVRGLSFLQMPPSGRILTGYYEGAYAGISKLYDAMNRYIQDKRLKTIALPYERYLTDPISASDSLHMKIELCFPVL